MSILYRVLIKCDRCDEEHELHEDWRLPCDARWQNISTPRGWRKDAREHDADFGHICPSCRKELSAR